LTFFLIQSHEIRSVWYILMFQNFDMPCILYKLHRSSSGEIDCAVHITIRIQLQTCV